MLIPEFVQFINKKAGTTLIILAISDYPNENHHICDILSTCITHYNMEKFSDNLTNSVTESIPFPLCSINHLAKHSTLIQNICKVIAMTMSTPKGEKKVKFKHNKPHLLELLSFFLSAALSTT